MTMRTRVTTLCCLLLVSMSSYAQSPADRLPQGARYVALGSSFAAGPGIPRQLGICGRSDHNYANLVARALDLSLTDASCSGATVDNIRNTPQNDMPPQIDAVTPDTALVTITIGGNDISYTSSTFACSGTAADEHCTANLDRAAIDDALEGLPGELGAMLDEIESRAPRATIVFVNYPRMFPTNAVNCSELALSPEDTAYLADLGQRLEDVFIGVTASRRVPVANAYVRAAGHGPCAPVAQRWVNGATVAVNGSRYHPTAAGHAEMARLVLDVLESN